MTPPPAAASATDDGTGVVRRDLREHLPGIEPERRTSDWGRSERIEEAVDRTVVEALYRYWFRVDVHEIGHVPRDGGALLLANGGGVLPLEALLVGRALRERHPRRPELTVAVRDVHAQIPGLGTTLQKLGIVADHPSNLVRLLHDERRYVLTLPRRSRHPAVRGGSRVRIESFATAPLAAALAAGLPIVPVAVLGTEEARPSVPSPGIVRRIPGVRSLPMPAALPLLGPFVPLPTKVRIRFLPPLDPQAGGGPRVLAARAQEEIEDALTAMTARRRSRFF